MYSGRAALAEIATRHGWSVTTHAPGADREDGAELVAYERYNTQVLIAWTPENTARWIVKNYGNADEARGTGPAGLITARSWLEEPAH